MQCGCDTINPDGDGAYCWPRLRNARKQHVCCECGSTIDINERYREISGIWEGRFERFKQCEICANKWDEIQFEEFALCIGFGELWNYASIIE